MSIDVRQDHLQIVQAILKQHVPDRNIVAFGSRIHHTAKDTSDLDLCIMGSNPIPLEVLANLRDAFSLSIIPFKIDVIDWTSIAPAFQKIINENHVVIQHA
ncbi:MAG: hypothetical protein A3F18_05890 [Legionellales bacterium RIFCSPHIGHO2_12_FULL_37_14]|nr:MAG: hypothetical protein A3F18_05890 [Legionellales bacterium RIFCSPHIGHO2_12_FULL_37_14]